MPARKKTCDDAAPAPRTRCSSTGAQHWFGPTASAALVMLFTAWLLHVDTALPAALSTALIAALVPAWAHKLDSASARRALAGLLNEGTA